LLVGFLTVGRRASVQYGRRRCPASFGSIKVRKLREGTVEKYYTLAILLCRCASVQYDRHRCPASLKNIIPFPSNSALVVVPFDTGTVWQERAPPVIQTIVTNTSKNLPSRKILNAAL
jgi:hypothetical protein